MQTWYSSWADQCDPENPHDPNIGRDTPMFDSVGQNAAGGAIFKDSFDWDSAVQMWFDEV